MTGFERAQPSLDLEGMTNGSNERLDRIEANIDRAAALLVQSAERRSVLKHPARGNGCSDQQYPILTAAAADGEYIPALERRANQRESGL